MTPVRPVRLPTQFRRSFWPRDLELAAKAIREGRRAVPLAGGSILYVKEE